MRRAIDLLRREPRARVFFAVLIQSSLGTGAAYVALLLIAYDRFRSPWAISLVLIADLLPPMLLGPIFGAAADRWSRRACAVVADAMRAVAFIGLALVSSFEATLALAFLAGAGTGLFTPATLAALPSLVRGERLPAATSVYGAIADFGLALGPALAAVAFLFTGPENVLMANAVTFGISALVLVRLDFGALPADLVPRAGHVTRALFAEARDGIRAMQGFSGLWPVLGASAATLLFGGLVNVAELPFITGDLGASEVQFSIAVAIAGSAIGLGSLAGGAGGSLGTLRRRFVMGVALTGLGYVLAGLAPGFEVLLVMFAVAGFGNGLTLVYERLIVQATVPDEFSARVFGVKDALGAWAFAIAFLLAGLLVTLIGPGSVIVTAGAGIGVVALMAVLGLRWAKRRPQAEPAVASAVDAPRAEA